MFHSYFVLDSESNYYTIHLDGYSGDCGDAMIYTGTANGCPGSDCDNNDQAFTTLDADHDHNSGNCAVSRNGGWWYNSCYYANLNGAYTVDYYHYFGWWTMPQPQLNASRMMLKQND